MKKQIDFLCAYTQWASELMWQALRQLSDEQWREPQDYSVGSVCEQITHVMYASMRWLSMLQLSDIRPEFTAEDFPTVASAEERWHEIWIEIYQYLFILDQEDLEEEIVWGPTSKGLAGETPRWQLISHMMNHVTDHRTQVFMLINTQYGIQTPEKDMIFYIMREEKRVWAA